MLKNSGQSVSGVVVSICFLALIIFLSGSGWSLPVMPLIFILALIVFLITFINTDVALIILIFSMLLSPELKIAEVPQRAVVVRIDDILLMVVFFTWLTKMAIYKELGLLRHTPINPLIVAYIVVCIVSTSIGIVSGHIHPLKSFFYIIKYVEYFILYFMVTNNIRDKKQIRVFIVAFLITCTLTCAYALATVGQSVRATAPFEGPHGEPNTLGGYLILLFAIVAGLFIYAPSRRWRFACAALAFLIFVTLLQTLSRGGYLAFISMYLFLITFTRTRKILVIGALILGIFIVPVILPKITKGVTERVVYTFSRGRVYVPLGKEVTLEASASARIERWKSVVREWKNRPFLGFGITGVGLVDAQYPLVLGETGIIGLLIFIWLMIAIFRNGLYSFSSTGDDWTRGLALGFLAGFVGLLTQAFVANTFIIVRIMEPFWFLAAIAIMLPELKEVSNLSHSDIGT